MEMGQTKTGDKFWNNDCERLARGTIMDSKGREALKKSWLHPVEITEEEENSVLPFITYSPIN